MIDLLIRNIGELATAKGSSAKAGKAQGDVEISKDMAVGIKGGVISFIGKEKDAPNCDNVLDANGSLVTPGLVDAHTHLVFGGWRQNEMELKLKGASYLDILKDGGGILSTVRSTRAATKEELYAKADSLLLKMLEYGTTTCEAKSGYGLSTEEEIKQLEVIRGLQNLHTMDIVPTFMGAHAIPEEYKGNEEGFVKYICENMIPAVAQKGLAEFCDIFCETAVFNPEQSKLILETAKKYGFEVKIHADEIDPIGGAELAGELKAISAEHLIQASDAGIQSMAKNGVIAVLLPATSFYLDKPFARARKMVESGIPVAIASDFNPGSSPNFNLQFAMNLACLKYKLTPKEALMAVTLNSAAAIKRADKVGTLELGKKADVIVWDAPDLNYLFYRYGNNLAKHVIKDGQKLTSQPLKQRISHLYGW